MDEEVATSFWISFFVEAGIPSAACADYAIIFTENRIQKHMLLDLNKEYLKDMGVNVLGDIIAILKHSKRFHEKVAREKVLATDKETSVLKATKHLNELLLKEDVSKIVAVSPKRTETVVPAIQQSTRPSPPKKMKIGQTESRKPSVQEDSDYSHEETELKRKVIPPSKVPAKPISVPTTKMVATKKTSVFDRLGESSVTSTTPEIPNSSPINTSNKSVFNRLGGVADIKDAIEASPVAKKTATTIRLNCAPVTGVKVLPTISNHETKEAPTAGKGYLRMDTEITTAKSSARERLGLDKPTSTKTAGRTSAAQADKKNHERRPSVISRTTKASGVQQRLGRKDKGTNNGSKTTASTKSVFSRLSMKKNR